MGTFQTIFYLHELYVNDLCSKPGNFQTWCADKSTLHYNTWAHAHLHAQHKTSPSVSLGSIDLLNSKLDHAVTFSSLRRHWECIQLLQIINMMQSSCQSEEDWQPQSYFPRPHCVAIDPDQRIKDRNSNVWLSANRVA